MGNGGVCLSSRFLDFVYNNIPEGSTILEFGSGTSTGKLVDRYTVFSIEENESYVGLHHDNYLHAEIVDDWYNKKKVIDFISDLQYDAIIVDGPAHGLRKGILDILEYMNLNVPIFIDDLERADDRAVFSVLSSIAGDRITRGEARANISVHDFIYYGGII